MQNGILEAPESENQMTCKICGGIDHFIGSKRGSTIKEEFKFSRCASCGFVTITNPCLDFAALYDERYYHGEGADPLVDYASELEQPQNAIRIYEWRGIATSVEKILGGLEGLKWLDFGSGSGGLVRYLRETKGLDCVGYDTGGFTDRARKAGIPIIDDAELAEMESSFDVVTMIEVIEHLPDPVSVLQQVAKLLKPNGLLFLTTGNTPESDTAFLKWSYVIPELHIAYFAPRNMKIAMEKAGLIAQPREYKGWQDIIRFKVLKVLKWKKTSWLERVIPWWAASPLVDKIYGASLHPVGRRPPT